MTQIKIEVPSNDPIALSALGEALQRIATERKGEQPYKRDVDAPTREDVERTAAKLERNAVYGSNVKFEDIEPIGPTIEEMIDDGTLSPLSTDDTMDTLVSDMGLVRQQAVTPVSDIKQGEPCTESEVEALDSESDDTLDKDGLPWDKRIHSRGKTRLADDTWRLARKPNDKTQEEWDEYVASVKAELKAVQDIPAPNLTEEQVREEIKEKLESGEVVVQAPTEALVTPPVVETEVVTPPTLDEQAVADIQLEGVTPNGDVAIDSGSQATGEPVAAVEPPASVTAPVTTDNTPSVSTFQELMKYITSDAAKRGATNDMIKEVLAQVDPSLTAIPLIANRADLIPTFVAKLEGRLS